jgi:hypothetical protein
MRNDTYYIEYLDVLLVFETQRAEERQELYQS